MDIPLENSGWGVGHRAGRPPRGRRIIGRRDPFGSPGAKLVVLGASFTNLQVRVGPGDGDAEVAAVREAILTALSVDFVEAGPDEEAERTAVIAPPLRGWISVYDEELDRQAEEPLAARFTTCATETRRPRMWPGPPERSGLA